MTVFVAWMVGCSAAPVSAPIETPRPEVDLRTDEQLGRDCYDAAEVPPMPSDLRDLGSFQQIRSTEDHAYGWGIELMHQGSRCMGLLLVYPGDIEPRWSVLRDVECTVPGGPVRFHVGSEWWTGFTDIGPFAVDVAFDGVLSEAGLQGELVTAGEPPEPFRAPREAVALPIRWEQLARLEAADRCVGTRTRTR